MRLLVLGNFSADVVAAPVPDAAAWSAAELLLGELGASGSPSEPLVLGPWEGRVYRRTD